MERSKISIRKDGTIVGILNENFDSSSVGRRTVHRLSDVYWSDVEQGWIVNNRLTMQPFAKVFKTREAAIQYEMVYMNKNFKKVLKFAGVR